jgi:tRNA(Arg) A34 adenosine deaminase TadA
VRDRVEVVLPGWVSERGGSCLPTRHDRMRYVVDLARRNVGYGTGGPFAAAVVAAATGAVRSVGVNLVVAEANSTAHAEMIAIQLAQADLGSHDLATAPGGPYELISSVEPCTMCLGAVVWSGVRTLVCGATDNDARAIGFDEGPKPPDWVAALRHRGIAVHRTVLRSEAAAVLQAYADAGGPIYNPGR